MVAYAVSASAGNTPRLKAFGAALLFVRFPATVIDPPVMFTFKLVPVAARAVPPANNSEFVPMTVLPVGAVPQVVGAPRATESHCVMFVLAFAGGTVVTVPLTTQGLVHCVTHTVPPVRFTFSEVPVAVRAVLPANSSEFVPTTLPVGAVPHAVGEPTATPFQSATLTTQGVVH